MKSVFGSACLFLVLLVSGCGSLEKDVTTIYLVRHAEKDLRDTTDNPPLTEEGRLRAEQLVEVFSEIPVEAIYSTSFDRNMNTVQPLAANKKLEIQNYGWKEWHSMLDQIKLTKGKNYVICGHGDNLLPMIEYLDGQSPVDSLGKYEYDKIFRVELQSDTTLVEVITY